MELAGDINLAMPRHVVDLVAEALNERGRALKGARVGVIGVAFKPNVRDPRNSPAADILAGLAGAGRPCPPTTIRTSRPSKTSTVDGTPRSRWTTVLAESDLVIVVTRHEAIDWERGLPRCPADPRHGEQLAGAPGSRSPGAAPGRGLGRPRPPSPPHTEGAHRP